MVVDVDGKPSAVSGARSSSILNKRNSPMQRMVIGQLSVGSVLRGARCSPILRERDSPVQRAVHCQMEAF